MKKDEENTVETVITQQKKKLSKNHLSHKHTVFECGVK
jgi:hypothetical protein